jgi:hypothetical protein
MSQSSGDVQRHRRLWEEVCDLSRHWRIWTCRCASPGPVWTEPPRHYTCAQCGALIEQVTVYRGPCQGRR